MSVRFIPHSFLWDWSTISSLFNFWNLWSLLRKCGRMVWLRTKASVHWLQALHLYHCWARWFKNLNPFFETEEKKFQKYRRKFVLSISVQQHTFRNVLHFIFYVFFPFLCANMQGSLSKFCILRININVSWELTFMSDLLEQTKLIEYTPQHMQAEQIELL